MKIRFLLTTASDSPEFPFVAGQVIHVDHLRSHMRKWLRDGNAELLPDVQPEAAVAPVDEVKTAVLPRAQRHARVDSSKS